jgi:hypothetical protein
MTTTPMTTIQSELMSTSTCRAPRGLSRDRVGRFGLGAVPPFEVGQWLAEGAFAASAAATQRSMSGSCAPKSLPIRFSSRSTMTAG